MPYHWETNSDDVRYQQKLKISIYKEYLKNLNHLEKYKCFLKDTFIKENISSIKKYFNTYIYMNIIDYKNGNYNILYSNRKSHRKHLKIYNRTRAKQENYSVFLKDFTDI